MTDPTDAVSGLREVCELNMSEEIQAELLRKIPEVPEVTLEMSGGSADLEVGQTARLAVTTNVFDAAITLETSGSAAAELTVCEGPGSLEGNRLAVSGDDTTTPETVTLCATGTRSGDMSVSAAVAPPAHSHIGWNQSPTLLESDECQVYAAFYSDEARMLRDSVTATFVEEPTDEPTEDATATATDGDLPAAGSAVSASAVLGALAFIVLGALVTTVGLRRRS